MPTQKNLRFCKCSYIMYKPLECMNRYKIDAFFFVVICNQGRDDASGTSPLQVQFNLLPIVTAHAPKVTQQTTNSSIARPLTRSYNCV